MRENVLGKTRFLDFKWKSSIQHPYNTWKYHLARDWFKSPNEIFQYGGRLKRTICFGDDVL